MEKFKMRPYSFFLFLFTSLLTGCLSSNPSDSQVLEHLKNSNVFVVGGCVRLEDFRRLNGFDRGSSYVVTFKVNQVMMKSQEACISEMSKSNNGDPFKGLALAADFMDNMDMFVDFSMNGGKRTIQGEVTFIKSEKGWIPSAN
jgi:hypothetical protein